MTRLETSIFPDGALIFERRILVEQVTSFNLAEGEPAREFAARRELKLRLQQDAARSR